MATNSEKDRSLERDGAARREGELDRQIESARRLAEILSQQASESPAIDNLAVEAIAELQTTLEELQVAEEELRQQNEELLVTRLELESERNRYVDLFEFAPDGYLITDAYGIVMEANRAATIMLGLEHNFLVGKPFASFIADGKLRAFREVLNRLSRSDSSDSIQLELPVRSRQDREFDAALTVAPDRLRKFERVTLRWMLRDITERRQAEAEIQSLNAELEEKVQRRTAELEQVNALKDELLVREQQARADAEAANRSKDEFLALVSHELRTPLNAMLGWTHLLRAEMGDQEQRERALEIIERNALAQKQMISDILDVSRIATGNLSVDQHLVDLATVIESAIEAARLDIEAKGIQLDAVLDRATGPVTGDPVRLQQVVGNLLSNSIKFTPAGGKLEVRLEGAGDSAMITVRDTGEGINPEFLPYVFDRFRQADSSSTKNKGGLGLGLSIVRLLVEMHGGTVRAMSEGNGKGATFTVTLPVAAQIQTQRTPPLETELENVAADPESLDGYWVLVVDDEVDARELLSVVLRSAGARVTAAETCAEALAVLSGGQEHDSRPDVLVADIAMPGEDGFDLIRAVRALEPERGGSVPAIALTAYAADEDRLRALAEGYQMHLSKPVTLTSLVAAVAKLASQKAS